MAPSDDEIEAQRQLGQRLRLAREAAGMSQIDAAVRSDINRHTLRRWENGESDASAAKVAALARLYGVSLDWLFSRSGSQLSLGSNQLLVCDEALSIATRLADNKVPASSWPGWMVQAPTLNLAARMPFSVTVVSKKDEADVEATLRSITRRLIENAR